MVNLINLLESLKQSSRKDYLEAFAILGYLFFISQSCENIEFVEKKLNRKTISHWKKTIKSSGFENQINQMLQNHQLLEYLGNSFYLDDLSK